MSKRRDFLRHAGVGVLASILPWQLKANKLPLNEIGWANIPALFNIKEGYVYLNNGTVGPSPKMVEEFLIDQIKFTNKTLQYGGGEIGREKVAELIHAKKEHITLTHNTTEGINVIAQGLPLKAKDEVIISSHEHVGNAMPWINRAQRENITVTTFKPALYQADLLNQVNDLIGKRTRVVALPHVSCTIGQMFPIKELVKLCREKDVWFIIDGAHGAGALHLDMDELDPDFYVTCGHKWLLGPKGTGFAYIKEEHLDKVKPIYAGAYTDNGFDITTSPATFNGYNPTAHRYDYGTQNAALYKGLAKAVEFVQILDTKQIEEYVLDLNEYLYQQLKAIDAINLISSPEKASRSMMLGFKHQSIDYKQIAKHLSKRKLRVRQVPESGLNSIRVSTHIYNSKEQIDLLINALKEL